MVHGDDASKIATLSIAYGAIPVNSAGTRRMDHNLDIVAVDCQHSFHSHCRLLRKRVLRRTLTRKGPSRKPHSSLDGSFL